MMIMLFFAVSLFFAALAMYCLYQFHHLGIFFVGVFISIFMAGFSVVMHKSNIYIKNKKSKNYSMPVT